MSILARLDSESPGKLLRESLQTIYPLHAENSFLSTIDNAFYADGELVELVYDSSINYLVRRLVTATEYLKRKNAQTQGTEAAFIRMLRSYLRDQTRIPSKHIETYITLLRECIRERGREPGSGAKNAVRREARKRNYKCYVCGRQMLFERNGRDLEDYEKDLRIEVEHLWPKAMGGSNKGFNLAGACVRCNRLLEDFIDASDFHYEEICLVTDKTMDDFSTDFNWGYRIAVLAKTSYKCALCERPAKHFGELQFARKNRADSWHFLNINAYCDAHVTKDS